MTKFAIFELVLIQQPEVNKHSYFFFFFFFQQVQLRKIVITSRRIRLKF